MILVREDEKFGWYASHACGIESTETLIGIDAIVLLTVDAEDRSVPFVNKAMWGVLVCLLCTCRSILVPVGIIVLPVREPGLLGVGVHRLKVEGTVVGDERLETLVVVRGKVINGETTEACAYASEAVLVNIRQPGRPRRLGATITYPCAAIIWKFQRYDQN